MMQAPIIQNAPPATPAPPAAPGVTVVTPRALAGPPVTAQDLAALKERRSELSDQLISATSRRHEVSRQLQSATGANRAGLEQRLSVLDTRIARLETDIDQSGQLLASAPYALIAQQESHSNAGNQLVDNALPILIVFTIFVLCPIAIAWARSIWKRGSAASQTVDKDTARRLERMEQSMDAIAVEIERVSEGQRFVTRLMAEGRNGTAIGTGQPAMEPLPIDVGEKSRV